MDLQSLISMAASLFDNGGAGDFFSSEAAKSLLSAFGASPEAVQNIILVVPKLIRGEIDFKALLPSLLPIVIGYLAERKNAPEEKDSEAFVAPVKLDPISDFADETIYAALEGALDSDNAL